MKLYVLCFLPIAINNKLSLEKIKSDEGLTISDTQDKQLLLPFILRNESFTKYKTIHLETGRRVKDILLNLREQIFVQNASWPCLTRSYLIELLFLMERIFSTYKDDAKSLNSKIKFSADDVLLYLHNSYMNKITISDLVKRFNTNRTTLSEEFKRTTSYTVIGYVLKTRIGIAAGMLRDTNLSIAVIIERVGFNNTTHFNKVFKEYTQYLPHDYRKIFRQ